MLVGWPPDFLKNFGAQSVPTCRPAADERDELAPPHSITSSPRAVVVPRASIRMRSRIFAIGSRRTIVAAAGLCLTAFFHRSGGDLRRSCRIRSNHSKARRHDRRAMRNVILVTEEQLQGVGSWFQCDLRLGLSST